MKQKKERRSDVSTSDEPDFYELDGIKFRMTNPDIDGDGKVGGMETVGRRFGSGSGTTQIVQPAEIAEVMKHINDDSIDPKTGMSKIDMNTRINFLERNGIVALDSLVGLGVCPPDCLSYTKQIKRLNVSIGGRGRGEMVDIVNGQRKHEEAKSGFGEKIKGLIGGNNA